MGLVLAAVSDHEGRLTTAELVELLVPPENPTEAEVKQALWHLVAERRLDFGQDLRLVLVGPAGPGGTDALPPLPD